MRAVLRLAGHELRARWLGWVVLALLVGLSGAVVLTAAAGARRTDSAYPAYLSTTRAPDYLISIGASGSNDLYDHVVNLPEVEAGGVLAGPPLISETNGQLDLNADRYVQ